MSLESGSGCIQQYSIEEGFISPLSEVLETADSGSRIWNHAASLAFSYLDIIADQHPDNLFDDILRPLFEKAAKGSDVQKMVHERYMGYAARFAFNKEASAAFKHMLGYARYADPNTLYGETSWMLTDHYFDRWVREDKVAAAESLADLAREEKWRGNGRVPAWAHKKLKQEYTPNFRESFRLAMHSLMPRLVSAPSRIMVLQR